jgi:hypothetical protein
VNRNAERSRPDAHRDKVFAIGFVVVFVPVLAALGLLLLGPMRSQREAFFAGLAVMGSIALVGFSQRRKKLIRQETGSRDAIRRSPVTPVAQIGLFAVILAVLVVIPRITGEGSWAALLGMFAGLAIIFVGFGLTWIFGKRPSYDPA